MKQLKQLEKLEAILELSKLLNSTKDTSTILDTLLKRSLDLIDGGDTGVIFIFNPETGYLEPKTYVGFDPSIEKIRLLPGESMTGLCFIKKESLFVEDNEKLDRLVSNMSVNNQQIVQSFQTKQFKEVRSSILCPMMHKGDALGVIVIDNYEKNSRLLESDVGILEAISIQATIALVNAMHFEQEQRTQDDLKALNHLLKNEKEKFQASLELQTLFTDMALKRYSLKAILESLNQKLSIDCFIVNPQLQVIESITPTLDLYSDSIMLEEIIREHSPIRIIHDTVRLKNKLWIRYILIHVNQVDYGWLGVISSHQDLDNLEILTLEHAIIAFALELLKSNEMRLQEENFKGDFLDAILSNQNEATLKRGALRYGFNFERNHQFIFIGENIQTLKLSDETQHQSLRLSLFALQHRLEMFLNKKFPKAISLVKDNLLIVILEFKQNTQNHAVLSLFNEFLIVENDERLSSSNALYCAIGPLITHTNMFNEAYQNTLISFKTAIELNQTQSPLNFEALEVKRLLMKNSTETLENFLNSVLGPLQFYENKSHKEFLLTLRLYITSNGNWTTTKNALHIHGNTLNYRLNRISEILSLNLDDYNQRLKLQMAFEIIDILRLTKGSMQATDQTIDGQ